MMNHVRGGPGNGTSTDSTISITNTNFDSLIRTFKARISESVRIESHVRGVPVTVLVRILGPQCIIFYLILRVKQKFALKMSKLTNPYAFGTSPDDECSMYLIKFVYASDHIRSYVTPFHIFLFYSSLFFVYFTPLFFIYFILFYFRFDFVFYV